MKTRNEPRPHSSYYIAYLNSPEWQQFRRYILLAAGNRCQRCNDMGRLEVHHLHYMTLGRESVEDVECLCPDCHKIADAERQDDLWRRRVEAWAAKKYGRFWSSLMDFDDVESEFGEWLERKRLI